MQEYKLIIYSRIEELADKIARQNVKLYAANTLDEKMRISCVISKLEEAKHFNEAVKITGITITKLDGTARGGMLFAIASELGIPIRYIGVGEAAKDLRPFDAGTFINAILPLD